MDDIQYFPCSICFEMREVRYSKSSKPYLTCNDCGVQLFIRGKEGIKKFKNLISDYSYKVKSQNLIELIDYYDRLKEQLAKVVAKKPRFREDKDLNNQEKVIEKYLKTLQKKINNWKV